MDLKSGYPFWPIKDGLLASYPALKQDISCDVAVIGGGITGALVSYHLVEAGADVVVLDRRDVGQGSTSASTALLIYELDTHMRDLAGIIGQNLAVRAYRACRDAIGKLERLVGTLDDDCGFERRHSLYFASLKRDVAALRAEYQMRRTHGFNLDLLGQDEIERRWSFSSPAALYSYDAAQADPFRLTHALLRRSAERGLRIYDRTEVEAIEHGRGGPRLTTGRGARVAARKLVFATGYEAARRLSRRLVRLKSTYAIASEPLDGFPGWQDRCLIWETSRPYRYLRTTADGRAIIGGEDVDFVNPTRRDALLSRKARKLAQSFRKLFPEIDFEQAYAWTGTFGETKDGMAYIGECDELPDSYVALGYGGNGVIYSMVAAEIIRDLYLGQKNPDAEIFRLER